MTKKDFELIAYVVRNSISDCHLTKAQRTALGAQAFVAELKKTNPIFDTQRFIEACTK